MRERRPAILLAVAVLLGLSSVIFGRLFQAEQEARRDPPPEPSALEAADPEPAPAPIAEVTDAPVFADWIALGSGCRGRFDADGDVRMERIADRQPGGVHRVRFQFGRFRLTSAGRADGEPLDFARECAVRIQLAAPPGKRIVNLTARTQVASTKSSAVKLTMLGELKIGMTTIGRSVLVYEPGASHGAKEDAFDFAPGATPDEALPPLACGEGKLVGFDYTWIAERKAVTDEVTVELSGDQALVIDAELTDC